MRKLTFGFYKMRVISCLALGTVSFAGRTVPHGVCVTRVYGLVTHFLYRLPHLSSCVIAGDHLKQTRILATFVKTPGLCEQRQALCGSDLRVP